MPFDLQNPAAPKTYLQPHGRRRRYWPYPGSLENLAYTPPKVLSWGSVANIQESQRAKSTAFVPKAAKPKGKGNCIERCAGPPVRVFAEQILQDRLMLENPGLLTAIKNTPIMQIRETPNNKIEFVQPHFTHKSSRSRYHLLVPGKERTALCKITDNLHREHETEKQELVNRKGRDIATKEVASIPSRSDVSFPSVSRIGSTLSKRKTLTAESYTRIAKNEGLLTFIRRKVARELKEEKIRKTDLHLFPSDVAFDQSFHTKAKPRKQKYTWEKFGGMESLCNDYPGVALFTESPSTILQQKGNKSEKLQELNAVKQVKDEFRQFPPEIIQLLMNAPQMNKRLSPTTKLDADPFSHFGLLETAKTDALDGYLKKLYRRDRQVMLPQPLLKNAYGPLKGMPPYFHYEKQRLPFNLEEDCPPFPEELEKVERAIQYEKQTRKERRAKGIKSSFDAAAGKNAEQFSKPIIESSHDISFGSDEKKSMMTLADYPAKYNELNKRDSSDSLFCQVGLARLEQTKEDTSRRRGKPPTESLPKITSSRTLAVASKISARKSMYGDWKFRAKPQKLLKIKPTTSEIFSTSSESPDELINGKGDVFLSQDQLRYPYPVHGVDSREFLPYPDVRYSSVAVPENVPGVEDNWLYIKLAEDQRSPVSSTESRSASGSGSGSGASDTQIYQDEEDEEEMEERVQTEVSTTGVILDKLFRNVYSHLANGDSKRFSSIARERESIDNDKDDRDGNDATEDDVFV